MSKHWRIIEKTIGILSIVLGLFSICILIISFQNTIEFLKINKQYGVQLTYINLIKLNHFTFILMLFSIISGILLLKNKIYGWMLTTVTWLTMLFKSLFKFTENYIEKGYENKTIPLILVVIVMVFFLTISTLLLNSEFKNKYCPKLKHWLIIIGLILLFLIDCFFIEI